VRWRPQLVLLDPCAACAWTHHPALQSPGDDPGSQVLVLVLFLLLLLLLFLLACFLLLPQLLSLLTLCLSLGLLRPPAVPTTLHGRPTRVTRQRFWRPCRCVPSLCPPAMTPHTPSYNSPPSFLPIPIPIPYAVQQEQWLDPRRGSVPIAWGIDPLILDVSPGLLDFYARTSTPNDTFFAGTAGAGYAYPWSMPNMAPYVHRAASLIGNLTTGWPPNRCTAGMM
jgi:hypothetical protein